MTFPSIHGILAGPSGWITTNTGYRCGTKEPEDLESAVPFVKVRTYGGFDRNNVFDTVAIDVDCYAGPSATGGSGTADIAAETLAEELRYAMVHQLPNYSATGGTINKVVTTSRPTPRDWDDSTDIARYHASYEITVHATDM